MSATVLLFRLLGHFPHVFLFYLYSSGAVMFHNSSHRKYWIFKSEEELDHMRRKANQKFRNKILESGKVSVK